MYLSKFAELGTFSINLAIDEVFKLVVFLLSLKTVSETVTLSIGFPESNKSFIASKIV